MNNALTRITLVSVPERMSVYLRFGKPIERRLINPRCRSAFFAPESVFCRIWWQGNAYGTTCWRLSILQAKAPGQCVQEVSGVAPGAAILLHVQGGRGVQRVLGLIHTIEAQRVDPSEVAPSYWRMVQNRMAARAEIGPFSADRHAGTLLRRSIP